ncbi:glycosyltransferase family A protein [Marinobacter sp. CHS3-4]|uniref:glycosyltransferase family 2 protein n=1 Tax=Marinobacter sp. CHS3-4 TaxID=3045174 RepID=UPI0024B50628|nr:glycosyltransferase family A protein [Marinobacter sp. CHS3-4]MDI9244980.1 glycosyltransferase family A protein [Marinobacter sp. CHS3-4]
MNKRLCIIVPVYNDWWRVEKNLPLYKDLIDQYGDEVDLIFVDNGSAHVPAFGQSWFSVLICEKPGSYSARNFALARVASDYEYFAFTDADCIPSQDWIPRILRWARQGFDLLAGDVQIFAETDRQTFVESYDMIFGLPQKRYVSNGYAVTANLTVSAKVFNAIGHFNDSRFSGGDAELCRRATRNGFRLEFDEGALVYHPARISSKEIIQKIRRVTGGQTGNGSLKRRLLFLFFNFLPPIRAYKMLADSRKDLSFSAKFKAFVVLTWLWPVRAYQSVKSLLHGPDVR